MNSIGIFSSFQYDAFQWCVENGIKVYCLPKKKGDKLFEIEINNNGEIIHSGKKYKEDQVDNKIWELYCHYYTKYNI